MGSDPETALAALPDDTGLEAASAERFDRERARINRHHRQWRASMPAVDNLFEDDTHRAKALAANLATELEQVLQLWATTCASAPERRVPVAEMHRRIAGLADEWPAFTAPFRDAKGWDEEPNQAFDSFLAQLTERARSRAQATCGSALGALASTRREGRFQALLRRALRRLFHPGD